MLEYSNHLDQKLLLKLFHNEINVLCIKNYKKYNNIQDILSRIDSTIKDNKNSSYAYTNNGIENIVSHICSSSYEIDNDKVRFDNYYNNVDKNFAKSQYVFAPEITPIECFLNDLNVLWDHGATIDSFHAQAMFAGIIRVIHDHSAIHAHQDFAKWSNPRALGIDNIVGQFGMNYFIQIPEEGGELLCWNKSMQLDEFNTAAKGDFCIPIDQLPTPDLIIKPEVGMLVLLNANKLHAINMSYGSARIAMSCFLAYRGTDHKLTIWS